MINVGRRKIKDGKLVNESADLSASAAGYLRYISDVGWISVGFRSDVEWISVGFRSDVG